MTKWRSIDTAPKTGDPVTITLADGSVSAASWHNGQWVCFNPSNPADIYTALADVEAWRPLVTADDIPELERELAAEQARVNDPIAAAEADLAAIRAELAQVEASERAEAAAARQRQADDARRQADDAERAAERERLEQWRQLFERK
jgi:Skp family chaperone for outer membrane proteins